MKRIIIYILLIISFTSLGIIGLKNQPIDLPEKELLNKELYLFNTKTGDYEILKITSDKFEYTGESLDLNNCKKYEYNSGTGILKLDCNKAIRIVGKVGNSYVFKVNNNNVFFYFTKSDSYNGEFQRTFNTTKENYVTEGITKITPLSLDYNTLIQTLSSNEIKYIYIKSNDCSEICDIYNNIYSSSNMGNKYYLELNTLTVENLINLENINKPFRDLLTGTIKYPLIIEVQNNNIIRNFEVKVDGLDFSNYINLDEEKEILNEQNKQ